MTAPRWTRTAGFLVTLCVLAFAIWRRYSNWPAVFDIGLWDETTFYLNKGITHTFDFANYEFGPLYAAYYYAVGLLVRDATNVYFIGGLIIQLLTLWSLGFAAWVLTRSLAIAVSVSGLILCSPFLIQWPRVSYLAVAFVALGSCLATLETRLDNRLALTLLVSFLACFVRPEFVLGMYLAMAALVVVLVCRTGPQLYRDIQGRAKVEYRSLLRLGGYLAVTGLLCLAWSVPVFQGGERAMDAFTHHYALRWVSDHHVSLDSWLNTAPIAERAFPGATTPFQALLSNPTEWLRFVISNILEIVPSMGRLLLAPEGYMLAFWLFGLLSVAAWSMRGRLQRASLANDLRAVPLIECGLLVAGPLAGMAFVFPRPHYAVIVLATLMMCCVAVGRWHPWSKRLDVFLALLGAVAVAIAAHPLPVQGRPILQAIMALRTLNLPLREMVEVDGGWCTYLKPRCEPVFPFDATAALTTVLDGNVDAIIVSKRLTDLLRVRDDRSLDALSRGANGTEWHRNDIGPGLYLLHREIPARLRNPG